MFLRKPVRQLIAFLIIQSLFTLSARGDGVIALQSHPDSGTLAAKIQINTSDLMAAVTRLEDTSDERMHVRVSKKVNAEVKKFQMKELLKVIGATLILPAALLVMFISDVSIDSETIKAVADFLRIKVNSLWQYGFFVAVEVIAGLGVTYLGGQDII